MASLLTFNSPGVAETTAGLTAVQTNARIFWDRALFEVDEGAGAVVAFFYALLAQLVPGAIAFADLADAANGLPIVGAVQTTSATHVVLKSGLFVPPAAPTWLVARIWTSAPGTASLLGAALGVRRRLTGE